MSDILDLNIDVLKFLEDAPKISDPPITLAELQERSLLASAKNDVITLTDRNQFNEPSIFNQKAGIEPKPINQEFVAKRKYDKIALRELTVQFLMADISKNGVPAVPDMQKVLIQRTIDFSKVVMDELGI